MRLATGIILTTLAVSGLAAPRVGLAEDAWPQFRGPGGMGVSGSQDLPAEWGGLLSEPAWKTDLPGQGWSSPVVADGRVWVTAAEQTALDEAELKRRLENHKYGAEVFQADAAVRLFALELDASTGKLLRRIDLLEVADPTPIHAINSYASPTPVVAGGRLYCHFGSLGTAAADLSDGKVLWSARLVVEDITGPAASPVLVDDKLVLVRDGCDEQYLAALDIATGRLAWRTDRPPIDAPEPKHRRGFSTPLLIEHQGRRQLIAPAPHWVVSYDPSTGRELWRARVADGHALVPRPVYADGVVYCCSGYPQATLTAVAVDGQGDVTETHVRWTYDKQVPLISSPLVDGDELYFVSVLGIARCLDRTTGQLQWKQRLRGSYAASPLLADGKLYFTSKEGVTTVVRPGRQYEAIAENKLYGETMASLAVANQSLLLRTASSLYCLRRGAGP